MWHNYSDLVEQHTVVGDLRVYKSFYSPQLDNHRDLLVWLPPEYENGNQRYPVIYMHDAQNLFDEIHSFAGEWRVDETLTQEGLDVIIVGLPNMNEMRRIEYNPYPQPDGSMYREGRGDAYISFIADTVKPFIDSAFRTRPEKEMTGIAGASMGGLISLHGFLMYPKIFGFCGAFSPVFWIGTGLQQTIQHHANGTGRIYLDVGGKEGDVITLLAPHLAADDERGNQVYVAGVRQLHNALLDKGYKRETLMYVEAPDDPHIEPAWARRFPDALRFLLPH
jgi:predicted alpha/beta superfamily hydrolase